jgi:DNA sulfur modification protein DndD
VIIKSIKIKNFLSYHDSTTFDFEEGATLIIGQNNTGKSKLFDAYNWVLYDEAYKTASENWEPTKNWREEIVNRLAMKDCQINSKVEVSVDLVFIDEQSNKFYVTREYKIKKLDNGAWDCSQYSELALTKTDGSTYNTENLYGNEAEELLRAFFPKNLSRYFLFQGEGISKLLRLNQRSDFTKAIGELSGIKYFAKAKLYANNVYLKAKSDFENKEDSDANIQQQKLKLKVEIDSVEENKTDLNNKLDNEYKEQDIKQRKLEEKIEELSRYEECAKLLQEIKTIESQRDVLFERKNDLFNHNRKQVLSTWIYKKSEPLFENFLVLYRTAKVNSKIPEPIRQDFIKEMLSDHLCKVCGTDAPESSDQFKTISSFLNPKSLDKEIAVINTLSDTADSMKTEIVQILDLTSEFREDLKNVQSEIDKLRDKVGNKEEELRVVIERIEDEQKKSIDKSVLEKINLSQLKRDRDQYRSDLEQSKNKIDQLIGRKDETEINLKKLNDEFNELIDKSSNEFERDRLKLAEDIKVEVDLLHDNFLGNLISEIEQEANSYFVNMTKSNPSLSGKVRVDYERKEVYTIDELGIPLKNINQANKVSLQISFVAAVLSVSNKIWDNHFPFVADAPISALGGNNKISAVKTIIDIFRQSIVILKDDADINNEDSFKHDQVRQLIKVNSKIHNAYELRMEGGDSVENQVTKTIKLK